MYKRADRSSDFTTTACVCVFLNDDKNIKWKARHRKKRKKKRGTFDQRDSCFWSSFCRFFGFFSTSRFTFHELFILFYFFFVIICLRFFFEFFKRSPHFFPRRERLFARFLFLVMTTTEVSKFDRESTATSRRVEKRDFSNFFDDAERYRGDRVSNAFVKKLIKQRKEREEKWFAFEQQKWFDTQRNIQADQELEKMRREVEEMKRKYKREIEEMKRESKRQIASARFHLTMATP